MKFAWDLQIKYSEGGERAVTNFEAGKAGYEARSFRGLGVFSSSPFEVSEGMHDTAWKSFAFSYSLPLFLSSSLLITFLSLSPSLALADADSVQMLQRSTQVGEFYRMSPPAVFDEKTKLPATYMVRSPRRYASRVTRHASRVSYSRLFPNLATGPFDL